jgi:coiled-coil domain-containing protein 12
LSPPSFPTASATTPLDIHDIYTIYTHTSRELESSMSSHETLAAASNDRKSRLAHLKSLKRKQAPTDDEPAAPEQDQSTALTRTEKEEENDVAKTYLSGRNYDPETRNVKLGFGSGPIADPTQTLEYKAQQLALKTKEEQAAEEKEDKPLDLFKLQPKKPNWDLKRDLEAKMKPLDVRTENAIARMVRERVAAQKQASAMKESGEEKEGEEVGMRGTELVEAMHLMEKEGEAERKRDEEEDVS